MFRISSSRTPLEASILRFVKSSFMQIFRRSRHTGEYGADTMPANRRRCRNLLPYETGANLKEFWGHMLHRRPAPSDPKAVRVRAPDPSLPLPLLTAPNDLRLTARIFANGNENPSPKKETIKLQTRMSRN